MLSRSSCAASLPLALSVRRPAVGSDAGIRQRCSQPAALLSAALPVLSGYDSLMIEESGEQLPQESEPTSTTSGDMAEALNAMRASSPSLGATIDAAEVSPDELAGAHGRATSDEPDAAKPTPDEG